MKKSSIRAALAGALFMSNYFGERYVRKSSRD